jgi:hypothetical protein
MSLKSKAVKVSPGHWTVEGQPCPVDVFLNDKLFEASEDGAWGQVESSAKLPGVKRIVITPDMHTGYGVPIGCVIETEGTLLPTAAGYDIGCFTEDTTISLVDGRELSFRELVTIYGDGGDFYVYSMTLSVLGWGTRGSRTSPSRSSTTSSGGGRLPLGSPDRTASGIVSW